MMAGKKAKGARAGRLRPSAVRLVLAWISFALMVFTLAGVVSSQLPQVQLVPALLAANLVVAAFWLVLAFVVGRVYCAVACPLGIGQDLVLWLSRRLTGKPRLSFVPERRGLRYGVLALAFLPLLLGVPGALLLLDPYSIFGRLVTDLFALPAAALRNGLAGLLEAHGAPLLLSRSEAVSALGASFALAAGYFLVLAVLSWRYGRWFCGNLCPVGTLLGTVSRVSRFRPVIDGGACVHCGRCERSCRASCIDAQQGKIDASRCVDCLDCLSLCPTGALRFGRPQGAETAAKPENVPARRTSAETATMETPETSRKTSEAGMETAAPAAKSEASPQTSKTATAPAAKTEAMTEAARQTSEALSVEKSEAAPQTSETMAAAESEAAKATKPGAMSEASPQTSKTATAPAAKTEVMTEAAQQKSEAASMAKSEAAPQTSEPMAAAESEAAKATKPEAMTEAAQQKSEAAPKAPEAQTAGAARKMSRRQLLLTSALAAGAAISALLRPGAAMPELLAGGRRRSVILPPGAAADFSTRCTACHLCIGRCPSGVLVPTGKEGGLLRLSQPRLDFRKGYCVYNCNFCSQACPTGAIQPLALSVKQQTKLGIARYAQFHCLITTESIVCGICAQHCPVQAITMVEQSDGRSYPKVDASRCIGCGTCEYYCPAKPAAISVSPARRRS